MNPQLPYPYGAPPPGTIGPGVITLPSGLVLRPPPAPMPLFPRPALHSAAGRPPVLPKPAGAPGAPGVVAPAPRLAPGVMPPKSTTLYVGKIAPSCDDGMMRALLEACGPVRSWKRVQDPETQAPKGFGFCEYEEAEGVEKALQLLNGLALDGQELLLKPNTATQRYIEELAARKAADEAKAEAAAIAEEAAVQMDGDGVKAPKEAAAASGAEEGEDTEASKENAMLEKIMGIVSEHAAKTASRTGHSGAAAAADEFLSSLDVGGRGDRRGDRRGSGGGDHIARAAQRLEEDFLRDKERERREAESRRAELERAYRDAEKSWERHERDAYAQAEAQRERERAAAKERARQLRADLETPDSDADEEPWARRPIAASQRAEARKRRREQEEAEDAAQREAEAQRAAAKRQRTGENGVEQSSVSAGASTDGARNGFADSAAPMHVDVNDPIYQAMIAAAKEQPKPAPTHLPPPPALPAAHPGAERARQQQQQEQRRLDSPYSQPSPANDSSQRSSGPARSKPLLSVFGGDEEEEKPKRKLIPLTYTEEERQAMLEQEQEAQQELQQAEQPAEVQPAKAEDSKAAIKTAVKDLIKSIPTDADKVFAWPMRWDAYDANAAALAPKISLWVKKKTTELLGEEELSMVEYVMNMVKEHTAPAKMVATLQGVMDDETRPFVLKLFRMLILETEKYARGIAE